MWVNQYTIADNPPTEHANAETRARAVDIVCMEGEAG